MFPIRSRVENIKEKSTRGRREDELVAGTSRWTRNKTRGRIILMSVHMYELKYDDEEEEEDYDNDDDYDANNDHDDALIRASQL